MRGPHLKSTAEAAGLLRGEKKRFKPGEWQLEAAKRYLDHRSMKLAAASRLEPRLAFAIANLLPSDSPELSSVPGMLQGKRLHPGTGHSHSWAGQAVSRVPVSLRGVQVASCLWLLRPPVWGTGLRKLRGLWLGAWMSREGQCLFQGSES